MLICRHPREASPSLLSGNGSLPFSLPLSILCQYFAAIPLSSGLQSLSHDEPNIMLPLPGKQGWFQILSSLNPRINAWGAFTLKLRSWRHQKMRFFFNQPSENALRRSLLSIFEAELDRFAVNLHDTENWLWLSKILSLPAACSLMLSKTLADLLICASLFNLAAM